MLKYIILVIVSCICITSTALVWAIIFASHPVQEEWNLSKMTACSRRSGIHLETAIDPDPHCVVMEVAHTLAAENQGCMFMWDWVSVSDFKTFSTRSVFYVFSCKRERRGQFSFRQITNWCVYRVIEANFILLCGSLSYLRQLLRYHAPGMMHPDQNHRHRIPPLIIHVRQINHGKRV
jgi:hypothetical protein